MNPIKADYTLTHADWVAASRLQTSTASGFSLKKYLRFLLVLYLLAGCLSALYGLSESEPHLVAVRSEGSYARFEVPASAALLLLAIFGVFKLQSRRVFHSSGRGSRPMSTSFTEEAMEWTDPLGGGAIQWRAFCGWRDGAEVFALLLPNGHQVTVPKRAFDERGVAALRALLASRIGAEGESRSIPDQNLPLPPQTNRAEDVVVEFVLTKQDISEAFQLQATTASSAVDWVVRIAVSGLIGLCWTVLYTWSGIWQVAGSPIHLAASLVSLCLLFIAGRRRQQRLLLDSGLYGTAFRQTLEDGMFSWETALQRGRRQLSAYSGWRESPNLFVILENITGCYIIPKRLLTAGQIETVRARLTAGVGAAGQSRPAGL